MRKLIISIGMMALSTHLYAAGISSIHPADMASFIQTHHPLIYLAVFFGAGVLLAFTPCVLPMVPILSGIITGQRAQSGRRALQLSLGYVIGMAVTYAVAGMLAAYFGSTVQTLMQRPSVLILFSALLMIMALWLLGVFEWRMPSFLGKIAFSTTQKPRGVIAVTFMGALSTLVVSPCVTAPLIGVLTYIAQSGQVLQGGLLLFVLALGMGLPLLLVGAGFGALLPRSGPWMIKIKQLFAIFIFAMALWLLGRVLPPFWSSLSWTALLVFSSFLLGIGRHEHHLLGRMLQGVAIIALMSAGALAYKTTLTMPKKDPVLASAPFEVAPTLADIQRKLAEAKAHHQAVFIEFFATWCSDCQAMDAHVFNQPDVASAMKNAVNLRVSVSDNNDSVALIKKTFGIYGIPTMLFYNADGVRIDNLTSVGLLSKKEMLTLLDRFQTELG